MILTLKSHPLAALDDHGFINETSYHVLIENKGADEFSGSELVEVSFHVLNLVESLNDCKRFFTFLHFFLKILSC